MSYSLRLAGPDTLIQPGRGFFWRAVCLPNHAVRYPRLRESATVYRFFSLNRVNVRPISNRPTTLGWDALSDYGNRHGYAGYEYDQAASLYHVRNRVLDPHLGRWLRRDPLGYVDGMSLYEYVGSRAVRAVDAWGLASGCIPWFKHVPWLAEWAEPQPGENWDAHWGWGHMIGRRLDDLGIRETVGRINHEVEAYPGGYMRSEYYSWVLKREDVQWDTLGHGTGADELKAYCDDDCNIELENRSVPIRTMIIHRAAVQISYKVPKPVIGFIYVVGVLEYLLYKPNEQDIEITPQFTVIHSESPITYGGNTKGTLKAGGLLSPVGGEVELGANWSTSSATPPIVVQTHMRKWVYSCEM